MVTYRHDDFVNEARHATVEMSGTAPNFNAVIDYRKNDEMDINFKIPRASTYRDIISSLKTSIYIDGLYEAKIES